MEENLFIILVCILTASFVLERWLDSLNRKQWNNPLSGELADTYDADKFERAKAYHLVSSRFSGWVASFNFVLIMVMIISGAFAMADEFAAAHSGGAITRALLFFGILAVGVDLLNLPFSYYSTFVIEERFGFNKTTLRTFILDRLKGYFLGGLLGGGLLAAFVWFYQTAGSMFWIWVWAMIIAVGLFTSMFYTSLILPLFNKLQPLPPGSLRDAIEEYSRKAGFVLDNIFIMDGSRRSTRANAFFSGLGPRKKIVLFDTLLQNHTDEELVAVLAHEVGHYKRKHTRTLLLFSFLQSGIMLFLLSKALSVPAFSQALGAQATSLQLGLVAFAILYGPVSMATGILANAMSRKFEFEADHFAAETYGGGALASALRKLSADNLSQLNPHPLYVFFNYSHPPLAQRLTALQRRQ